MFSAVAYHHQRQLVLACTLSGLSLKFQLCGTDVHWFSNRFYCSTKCRSGFLVWRQNQTSIKVSQIGHTIKHAVIICSLCLICVYPTGAELSAPSVGSDSFLRSECNSGILTTGNHLLGNIGLSCGAGPSLVGGQLE